MGAWHFPAISLPRRLKAAYGEVVSDIPGDAWQLAGAISDAAWQAGERSPSSPGAWREQFPARRPDTLSKPNNFLDFIERWLSENIHTQVWTSAWPQVPPLPGEYFHDARHASEPHTALGGVARSVARYRGALAFVKADAHRCDGVIPTEMTLLRPILSELPVADTTRRSGGVAPPPPTSISRCMTELFEHPAL